MRAIVRGVAALGMVVLLSGCETLLGPSPAAAQRDQEMQDLVEKVKQLQAQVRLLRTETEAQGQEIEALRGVVQGPGTGVQARLDAIERELQGLIRARDKDRSAIVEDLTRRIGAITESQGASRGADPAATAGYGYEHVVQAGETLSEIARAYKVSASAIVKANRMKSEKEVLRVGQKLFIPEKK